MIHVSGKIIHFPLTGRISSHISVFCGPFGVRLTFGTWCGPRPEYGFAVPLVLGCPVAGQVASMVGV